ncbi:Pectinesterase inhibitor 11 [Sesamum alatum]|uniref:Pectinesterase inhibitor 11 n=1 Tax=Sesamum alatum TaxID=300844 RepID=A0AAE1Y3Z8_9LAMI|nr:Pectinesterase inhibitor 11 [Sesamum alatum]
MAKFNTFFLVLLTFPYMLSTAKSSPDFTDFIKAECRATRFPALCVQCLSTYSSTIQQSQKRLAEAALSVSLSRAQSVAIFVSKLARMRGLRPTEYRAIKDCIDNMANTVDQLNQSVQELSRAGQDFDWHVGNVESWVGAALTFEHTCLDGFGNPMMDGNVKVAVTRRVTDCEQVTSNALVLVHRFAARHKVGASSEETANLP